MLMKFGDCWLDPTTVTAIIPRGADTSGVSRDPAGPRVSIHHKGGQLDIPCGTYAEASELSARFSAAIHDAIDEIRATPRKP